LRARIHEAVLAISEDVDQLWPGQRWAERTESNLWLEMVGCVLATAVSDGQARRAASRLAITYLGQPEELRRSTMSALVTDFEGVLRGMPSEPSYRFPRQRARQLASMAADLYIGGPGIRARLDAAQSPARARRKLVEELGMGPKQASLFLRNAGFDDDLAVFDRHIWKYMWLMGLSTKLIPPSRLTPYEASEDVFRMQAVSIGIRVGSLDRALWIVYRALRRCGV
jgi:N-glycosylase/DNA lyase